MNIDPDELQRLTRKRQDAAEALEASIAALGRTLGYFQQLTVEVIELTGARHIGRRLDVPLVLHLRKAHLGPYLDKKFTGEPASLLSIVEREHDDLVTSPSTDQPGDTARGIVNEQR